MPVTRSNEDIPASCDSFIGLACSICEREMPTPSECLSTRCLHIFHKNCISNWLTSSQECPNCKKLCHEKDLFPVGSRQVVKPTGSVSRIRGRGSAVKCHNTRSSKPSNEVEVLPSTQTESVSNINTQPTLLDLNSSINDPNVSQNSTHNTSNRSNRGGRGNRNINRMSQMIEATVQRMLSQMNVSPLAVPYIPPQSDIQQPTPPQFQDQSFTHQPTRYNLENSQLPTENRQHLNNVPSNSTRISMNPDKITTIIQSWNVKFDGSSDGLTCEEFLYRIKCLVEETFNGNFDDSVGKNLHVMLTGKAKNWYWRYRKSVNRIVWDTFCIEFKRQYKDYRTTFRIF